MKNLGIVRKIDPLGRIVFPSELRKILKMFPGDEIEIFADEEFIHIRKYEPTYKGQNICPSSPDDLKRL